MTGTELAKICIRHSRDPHLIVDHQNQVLYGNPAFFQLFRLSEDIPLSLEHLGPVNLLAELHAASPMTATEVPPHLDFSTRLELHGETLPVRVITQSIRMQRDERLRLLTLQPLRRRPDENCEPLTSREEAPEAASAVVDPVHPLVSRDPECRKALHFARKVASSDVRVVLLGESGTGKTHVARAMHAHSPRASEPFIEVNCAAIPEELLESELFGHIRGAFSGAISDRVGRFEAADGGTLFLDEIGEMSPKLQAKLLRAVQDGTFERVGENQPRSVNVRVISASNRDLTAMAANNQFRTDLFYRLAVASVYLPPLRERPLDLAEAISQFEQRHQVVVADALRNKLLNYSWPGNFREMENVFQCMCLRAKNGVIHDFPLSDPLAPGLAGMREATSNLNAAAQDYAPAPSSRMEHPEARRLREALVANSGNRTRAARALGIDRTTLWRKMHRYNMT
ncbi:MULTISPECIES: sigma-54-dependent Fis family transcriptional regulator [unclassified Thioalkalivibrio]|uniref:sigma-54 interaction domain-containing protein n=1 Tax=unclassified Thioalkalivibrio TaxID=2621013 RepID=UPI00036AF261|nr:MULTISPECIES: sigma-54 dependent transcriptional regulator [unclassified Thioalkalivibrio]